MKIIVAIGALFSMTGGIINCAYCFARAIYVMGRDGFFPAIFAKTNSTSHTPAIATMFGAVLSILITVFMDFASVIELISFTSFFEFIIVVMTCIILRFSPPQRRQSGHARIGDSETQRDEESRNISESSTSNYNVKENRSCSSSGDKGERSQFLFRATIKDMSPLMAIYLKKIPIATTDLKQSII